ncbi:leucine-rich repeat-containing protein 15-like [Chironomus tepperi]|uniref:leucine-rich repeat-containing protein 15-like n=1 Tax=Chironomus tepperi TaxID=113505 RepID=UPI00391F6083
MTTFDGVHVDNKTDNDVVKVISDSGTFSDIFPSFLCEKFKNLKSVDIYEMWLMRIQSNPFQNCSNLTTLSIRFLNDQELPDYLFPDSMKLRNLKLRGDSLVTLSRDLLENQQESLNNLEIEVYGNDKFVLQGSFFNPLVNLVILKIGITNLTYLNPEWFLTLSKLEVLEFHQTNFTVLKKFIFEPLKSLRKLQLQGNSLLVINSDSFTGLDNLSSLDLSSNKIYAIDPKLFQLKSLIFVDLAFNKCNDSTVVDLSLNHTNLRGLTNECTINYVNNDAFNKCNDSTVVDLSLNHTNLRGLTNECTINYVNNDVPVLIVQSLQKLYKMWTLKFIALLISIAYASSVELSCVKHSELEHVECQLNQKVDDSEVVAVYGYKSKIGESFTDITDLVLTYKNLPAHMPHGIGNVFKKLISFDVSSSSVKFFDKICFEKMEKVKFLRMSHNEIEELPGDVFEGLTNLQHLDMSRNKIKNLPSEIFAKNLNLKYVKLSENQLEVLDAGVFANNVNLRKIFLSGNKLRKISVDFTILSDLSFLDLLGNAGKCNFRFDRKSGDSFDLQNIQNTVDSDCN